MPRTERAAAVAETVRSALAVPGLLGREREGEERGIFWSDFPAISRLGSVRAVTREKCAALGLTQEEFGIAERVRSALPAELASSGTDEGAVAELVRQDGLTAFLGPLMRLKHLRESVTGASDVSGRIGEIAPVWAALAASLQSPAARRQSGVELDRSGERVCVRSWPRFMRSFGADGSGNGRLLARLREFGEDVRDPAVIFRDRVTYLAVSFLASMDGNVALRAAALDRLRALFAGERDPGTPLPEPAARSGGTVTVRAVDALPEGTDAAGSGEKTAHTAQKEQPVRKEQTGQTIQAEQTEQAKQAERAGPQGDADPGGERSAAVTRSGPRSVKAPRKEPRRQAEEPRIGRDFAREFAAEMDRAAPVIGGRQTTVERKGEILCVRVIPTAISGFLAQKGLSGKELERVRTVQFREGNLARLGIALLRPSETGGPMELEKRVKSEA